MSLSKLQHRRTHNLLLISRLLNLRERISPFTLILDSLEQSARPLLAEFVRRANASKTKAVFVSFETIKAPQGVDVFLSARGKPVARIQKEISALIDPRSSTKTLLIIDTLYPLVASSSSELPAILSSFLSPSTSLLAVYHTDVPIYSSSSSQVSPYSPQPLALLKYLCTALLVTHSFNHVLARKTARDRSLEEPVFGLAEGKGGAVVGLGSNDPRGVVLEMEYRRKSGRGVKEWYFLPARKRQGTSSTVSETASATAREKEMVILLEDHPLYRASEKVEGEGRGDAADVTQDFVESTFNLGLTEKQRKDREGVVLPYFDAQNEEGEVGEGGRILYEMGEEDDFDEEEDEI